MILQNLIRLLPPPTIRVHFLDDVYTTTDIRWNRARSTPFCFRTAGQIQIGPKFTTACYANGPA
jgi:hypothetical protein